MFRNATFNVMKGRGLVAGIDAVIAEFGYPWLKARRVEAAKARRQLTWSPWPPSKLLGLVAKRQKDVLENPYIQFAIGLLCNLAASLLFPADTTRKERAFLTLFVTGATIFGINYNKLRLQYQRTFKALITLGILFGVGEIAYFWICGSK